MGNVPIARLRSASVPDVSHNRRTLPRTKQVSTGHLFAPVCALVPSFRVPRSEPNKKPHPDGCVRNNLIPVYIPDGCIPESKDSPTDCPFGDGSVFGRNDWGTRLHFCRRQKLRCCRHPAGGKQQSTGLLQLIFESPSPAKKKRPPNGECTDCPVAVCIRTGCIPQPEDSPTD